MRFTKIVLGITAVSTMSFVGFKQLNNTPEIASDKELQPKCCEMKKCVLPVLTSTEKQLQEPVAKGCVFKTLFNEEPATGYLHYKTPENVQRALENGLKWAIAAQQKNGGWGAGLSSMQQERDPHAVATDPATTSMVAMALLRCGSTLTEGEHAKALVDATNYLLKEIESTEKDAYITNNRGTQIQVKLGQNIDAVITAQFFSNLLTKTDDSHALVPEIKKALDICVKKIQDSQEASGRTSGGSWAGVLQSSMANSALEAAQTNGAKVDTVKLEKARDYQTSNYDYKTGSTNTTDGAGIVLYSMSSSVRSSAVNARKVREKLNQAKATGKVEKDAAVSVETLKEMGYNDDEAIQLNATYQVYESAKTQAQSETVMNGFGNNGGEEFISFLQTGESMVVNKDDTWKTWYDNISAKMIAIQNGDGSWNGHHCITSPSFCTATCLLILSIHNDTEVLSTMGAK